MSVLVTRPAPDGEEFAEDCRRAGLSPIFAPLMDINFLSKKLDLSEIGALAFTSVNGVRAFARLSDRRDVPVFAVGVVTGAAASEIGFSDVHVASGDLQSLAALVSENLGAFKGVLLHSAGADRAGDLVTELEPLGVNVRRETLYEAVAATSLPTIAIDALRDQNLEWATFFSPRTAALFMTLVEREGLLPTLAGIQAACLSDAVADALSGGSWKSINVAGRRDGAAIIELIAG